MKRDLSVFTDIFATGCRRAAARPIGRDSFLLPFAVAHASRKIRDDSCNPPPLAPPTVRFLWDRRERPRQTGPRPPAGRRTESRGESEPGGGIEGSRRCARDDGRAEFAVIFLSGKT